MKKDSKKLTFIAVAAVVVLVLILVVLVNAVGKNASKNKETSQESSSEIQTEAETKDSEEEEESISEDEVFVDGTISQTDEAGKLVPQEFQSEPETEAPTKVTLFEKKEVENNKYDRDLETACLEEINAQRAAANLSALSWDEELYSWIKVRGKDLSESFSHIRPDGSDAYSLIPDGQYSFIGENIGTGLNMFTTAKEVVEAWMFSDENKDNVLSEDYESAAVVCYIEKDVEGNNCYYWVTVFRKK